MEITRIQKLLGHDHLNTTMLYARVLDKTLETDYQLAMRKIEAAQAPLSTSPELVSNWPQTPSTPQSQSQESEVLSATHSL